MASFNLFFLITNHKNINAHLRALQDLEMLNSKNSKLTPYRQIQLLHKIIEQDHGYEEAHKIISQAELEYAAIMNSSNIETR